MSSSSSSRISAKHSEATCKLKIAQLKLVHIEERANEEARRLRLELCLKKEIDQRKADREIALARAEYEIYNQFAAETKRLSDDVATILSRDNENTVETVVSKTCSEQTFARSFPLLSNNFSAGNTLSLGSLPPVQSFMSTGLVLALGLLPVQSSMSTGPVLGLLPVQSFMSTGPVLSVLPVQSSMCTGSVLGPLSIQSCSSTCQVWSSLYVRGPLHTDSEFSAGSSHMQVAPSVAHSYNFNRLPASNPSGPSPSSADSPIYSHVSPLLYPGVYNQNSVNYDSLFLPRPEFPKFSGDPLEYKEQF